MSEEQSTPALVATAVTDSGFHAVTPAEPSPPAPPPEAPRPATPDLAAARPETADHAPARPVIAGVTPRPERAAPKRFFGSASEVIVWLVASSLFGLIAVPNLAAARKHSNESNARRYLRSVMTAQSVFREGDKERDGNLDYGTLSELRAAGLLAAPPEGYVFDVGYSTATSEFLWFGVANPEKRGEDGDRSFQTNQSGVVYGSLHELVPDRVTCQAPPVDSKTYPIGH